ncbi:MAG TPA: hypothetical protein P5087_01570 [Eubacteriales bacterium]|nr:hypothetical protein [Eubacteriales bacterium]
MAQNIETPKKKSGVGTFFSWFFSIIVIAIVAVLVVVIFIAPVSKIKAGSFDLAALPLGESTAGEILGDSDITVFGLLQMMNDIKTVSDSDITYTPTAADKASAVATLKSIVGSDETDPDPTEEQIGQFALYVLSGSTPTDGTGIPKVVTFTDKELAYIFNLALGQIMDSSEVGVELNQLVINNDGGITLSTVMTLDLTQVLTNLPYMTDLFAGFEHLRVYSTYTLTVAGNVIASSATVTFGSVDVENSKIIINLVRSLIGEELDLEYFASTLFTSFVNNLGVVGASVGDPGADGITTHSVSIIVANTLVS